MFLTSYINLQDDIYTKLANSANFEQITKGRLGATLVDCKDDIISLVRTTTIYQNPPTLFQQIHCDIIKEIKLQHDVDFNNALIEIYSNDYRKMGFHSDQGLDLQDQSYICLYSCYSDPNPPNVRKLLVREKAAPYNTMEITLHHNSIVLFSTDVNKRYQHKIVLDANVSQNWLGITFRLSKTKLKFVDGIPYFFVSDKISKQLVSADQNQRKQFYRYRSLENQSIDYEYPDIDYTISESDMLIPI